MNLSHLIFMCLVVAGVAYLMMLSGISKSALELNRPRRICPSCGRTTRDCSCRT